MIGTTGYSFCVLQPYITLLLAKNNLIYYYFGKNIKDLKSSGYNGLRNIIIDKKRITKADDLFVIIKPGKEARYENAVNVLNEMSINDVKNPTYLISILNEPIYDKILLFYRKNKQLLMAIQGSFTKNLLLYILFYLHLANFGLILQ